MKMGHLQNIQSFETSIETGNLQQSMFQGHFNHFLAKMQKSTQMH